MRIILESDPFPEVDDPPFVKEAYPKLMLEVISVIEPGEHKDYPQGIYIVAFEELVRALAEREPRAAQYMRAKWGVITDAADRIGHDVLIDIPYPLCRAVH